MNILFEYKPTNHKSLCLICGKPILKGQKCLKAEQIMYPGIQQGRICMYCVRKEVVINTENDS